MSRESIMDRAMKLMGPARPVSKPTLKEDMSKSGRNWPFGIRLCPGKLTLPTPELDC